MRRAPEHFEKLPLVEVMGRPLAGWGGAQKAVFDYGLGILLTIILLPLLIVIVFAIRLDSKGPALFRQQRYGFVNGSTRFTRATEDVNQIDLIRNVAER